VDQPDGRDLHEVVQGFTAVGETAGDVLGHREEAAHELVPQLLPVGVVGRERSVALEEGREVSVLGVCSGHRITSPERLSNRMPTVGPAPSTPGSWCTVTSSARVCSTRQPKVSVETTASECFVCTCACTSMRSGRTRNVHRSHEVGAATST